VERAQRIADASRPHFRKILIVRTDRIGDVLLTLPMATAVRSNDPSAEISMMVRSYTREIVEGCADVKNVVLVDDAGRLKPIWSTVREIRRGNYDIAFLVFPRLRLAMVLLLAGVKVRVGSGYRWYSFLLNRRVYEHRKSGNKHEAEYNLTLLEAAGYAVPQQPRPKFRVDERNVSYVHNLRRELRIGPGDRLAILHPGSGGSARDWPPGRFSELATRLNQAGVRVAVTGSAEESALVSRVAQGAGVVPLAGKLTLGQLAAFIAAADLFVSNSTGPLHIAAAVGTPVICFYPPSRHLGVGRWGPLTDRKFEFVPDPRLCPRCRGGECEADECMDQIEVGNVAAEALKLLGMQNKVEAARNG